MLVHTYTNLITIRHFNPMTKFQCTRYGTYIITSTVGTVHTVDTYVSESVGTLPIYGDQLKKIGRKVGSVFRIRIHIAILDPDPFSESGS